MSAIETILSRAMNDAEFDELLFSDLDKAVAEYDVTPEEYARLKSLSRAGFVSRGSASPEERKSLAYIGTASGGVWKTTNW